MTLKSISKNNLRDEKGLTEEEYLLRYDPDKYPKPSLTADILIISERGLLMVYRRNHPFLHHWALPGGFANAKEETMETAKRELQEETGVTTDSLTLLNVYSQPNRDPRGWVVSVVYLKEISEHEITIQAGDDALKAEWFHVTSTNGTLTLQNANLTLSEEDLAFDHAKMIRDALSYLKKEQI